MRGLFITPRKALLSFANTEAAQSLDIFWCVVAPAVRSTTGQRQRPKSLAKSEPARSYTEFIGSLADRECPLLREHTDIKKSIS
jgi:hypothetical protein